MCRMHFPPCHSLPDLIHAKDLTWYPPSNDLNFWTGVDTQNTRWLVKLRGGLYAVREHAFSVIAQALNISCQSSTFLKMPSQLESWPFSIRGFESEDDCQLAIWLLDEHDRYHQCRDDCPLAELDHELQLRPYDLGVLRKSRVANALDWARGEMLGMLCEMHEPPGQLVTTDHTFVQIDNELMFVRSAGADLRKSPWVVDHIDRIRPAGLDEAIYLCKRLLSLPDKVFQGAIRMPAEYRTESRSVREEIERMRPRARHFLEWAARVI